MKNIKVYQDSYELPYHHGHLKIHITKTHILTSTLPLYVTISKHPLKTHHKHQKNNEEVPPNRLIMKNQPRNNNLEMPLNKIIIDEQFKNNIQECFSKKQKNINLENQLANIRKRKHQAFKNFNAINANDLFINLKVRNNIKNILESTEIIIYKYTKINIQK